MVSPDATPYVDLRVYDLDAQDIFADAITLLSAALPDWIPREGNTEVLLLEALALEVENGVFTINRLPGAIVQALLLLYQLPRDAGTPPGADFEFTLIDDAGYTLPAGIRIAIPLGSDDTFVVFSTDVAVVALAGDSTVTVHATGDVPTSLLNGTIVGGGVELQLLDSIAFVETVDLGSTIGGGVDPETDTAWFSRGVQRFSRLTETLVLPRHFTAAALEDPDVFRATTLDNYDSDTSSTVAGHETVVVYGDGAALSSGDMTAMQADLDSRAQGNLAVHVIAPTLDTVNVAAHVVALPGYDSATVQANCADALGDYLSTATWPWAGTVYVNELISLLDRVEGVDRVIAVTTPSTDLTLTGVAPLAVLGTHVITVDLP